MITLLIIIILIIGIGSYIYIEGGESTTYSRITQSAIVATSAVLICVILEPNPSPIPPPSTSDFGGYRPSYQGHGTKTVGGRSGEIRRVNTATQLIEAIRPRNGCNNTPSTCSRIVIFDTSGNYDGIGQLSITSPFLTIAGQTSPDDGVTLTNTRLLIDTHDVVIQHIKVRKPPYQVNACSIGEAGDGGDNSHVYNVVLDHVTCTWAEGSNVLLVAGPGSHDVSILDSLVGEALWPMGWGGVGAGIGHHNTIARNVFTQSWGRQPIFGNSGGRGDIITQRAIFNNINYNGTDSNPGGGTLSAFFGDLDGDGLNPQSEENVLINNYSKLGPDSGGNSAILTFSKRQSDHMLTFLQGNIGQGITGPDGDGQWNSTLCGSYGSYTNVATCGPSSNMRTNQIFSWFNTFEFVIIPSDQVFDSVLSTAGSRPKNRDSADEKMINELRNATGTHFLAVTDITIPSLRTQTIPCVLPSNPTAPTTNGRNALDDYLESDSVCGARRLE